MKYNFSKKFQMDCRLSLEEILSKFEVARYNMQVANLNLINLQITNAPEYMAEDEYENVQMYTHEMLYWEKVRNAHEKLAKCA